MLSRIFLICILVVCTTFATAQQPANCVFKEAQIKIDFGTNGIADLENGQGVIYRRLRTSCPVDGFYSYAFFTSDCFNSDWHTLAQDHTPGDINGNMLLVNSAPNPGRFLSTNITGLKPGTIYEFGFWIMNMCRITDKCGDVLLPNLIIRLEDQEGKKVAQFATRDIARVPEPKWTQHRAIFTTPASITELTLTMMNLNPGGCGNDFAMDDISFRECIVPPPPVVSKPKPVEVKKKTVASKPVASKPVARPVVKEPKVTETKINRSSTPKMDASPTVNVTPSGNTKFLPPPPPVLANRANPVVKRIETTAGEIKVELYDNGEIDGDTVSIYHNNVLIKARSRLSEKPISFSIAVDAAQPYHELVMVAENLGNIPPNTSVMIIYAGGKRHEVFISATEVKNAKVVVEMGR